MSENLSDIDLLMTMVWNLVEDSEAVHAERIVDDKGVLLTLHVGAQDMGKVIGKEGQTAQAIRTIMRAKGRKQNATISIKIAEPENREENNSHSA